MSRLIRSRNNLLTLHSSASLLDADKFKLREWLTIAIALVVACAAKIGLYGIHNLACRAGGQHVVANLSNGLT